MFHKTHLEDLTQKTSNTNHKSARDLGAAIGVMLVFFNFLFVCFDVLGVVAAWN